MAKNIGEMPNWQNYFDYVPLISGEPSITLAQPEISMASVSRSIALVTGGNNGIGYEIVKALFESSKPYHVLIGSRSLEKANVAVDNLKKQCPDSTNSLEVVQVDLTSDESITQAFEQVKASPGHIDTLINNAGESL